MHILKKIFYLGIGVIPMLTVCSDASKKALNDSLIIAVEENSPKLVSNLIISGADVNIKSPKGETPLIIAAKRVEKVSKLPGAPSIIERDKALEIIKALIDKDANMEGFEKFATQEPLKMQLMFSDKVKKYVENLPGYTVKEKQIVITEKEPQPAVITKPISREKKSTEGVVEAKKIETQPTAEKKEQTDQTTNPLKADVIKTAKPDVKDQSAK